MNNNGFKMLYEKLFSENNRIIFEVMNKDGKKSIDTESYLALIDNISANLNKLMKRDSEKSFIGIKMSNSPYMYAVIFSVLKLGFSVLLVDSKSSSELCAELLNETHAAAMITDNMSIELNGDFNIINSNHLYAECNEAYETQWNDTIAFSTSGTTGKSKIIAYDSEAIFKQIDRTAEFFKSSAEMKNILKNENPVDNRFISILPMHHIFGFATPLILLEYGFILIFPANAAISAIIKTISSEKVWGCIGVPMFWQTIYNLLMSRYGCVSRDAINGMLGEKFTFCLSGGSCMDIGLRKAFSDAEVCFTLGFGMTEIGCATMLFPSETDIKSEGKIYGWYDSAIRNEDGSVLGNGTGELLVKSDVIFKGYCKEGKIVEREKVNGEYYPTGDIFRKDGKIIYFVGRRKNIIVNSAGENIYTEELEKHFDVLAKYGMLYGIIELKNEPCIIVQTDDANVIEKVKDMLFEKAAELPVYKRPCKAVFTMRKLPLTSKGELKKFSVTDDIINDASNIEIIFKRERN